MLDWVHVRQGKCPAVGVIENKNELSLGRLDTLNAIKFGTNNL